MVRFAFTSDQLSMRDSMRDVLARECKPEVVRATWESGRGIADRLWRTLVELGVVGACVPEANGGMGLDAVDAVLLFEEHGRAAAPTPLLETAAIAAPILRDHAPEDLRARWLPAIARGDATIAVGLGPLVRDAHLASLFLLERDGALLVASRDDVTIAAQPSVDRARALFAVGWDPSRAASLGEAAARDAHDRGAVAAAAELVGVARRLVAMTVDYAKVRRQFGAAIGSFQAVKHHLASAHVRIELAAPAVYRAAQSIASRDPDRALHASVAKASASDAALLAARVALQCHGAIGYSFEHDLHLWMKRAWALAASWGDAAHHRARVADAIAPLTQGAVP